MARPESHSEPVNGKRLIDAADMLLEAASKRPGGLSLIDLWTGDDTEAPSGAYTSDELIEAMLFLFRLGLAEPRDARVGR